MLPPSKVSTTRKLAKNFRGPDPILKKHRRVSLVESRSNAVRCACQKKSARRFTNAVPVAYQNATLRLLQYQHASLSMQACNIMTENLAHPKKKHRWAGCTGLFRLSNRRTVTVPCAAEQGLCLCVCVSLHPAPRGSGFAVKVA